MAVSPSLEWLSNMLQMMNNDVVKIPETYKEQVKEIKNVLSNDVSGLVNTVLDFCLNSASVDYSVETTMEGTTEVLNDWLSDVNDTLRGKIPVGIKSLAKEYFRERWKRGGLIVLRTIWETKDGYTLPTKLWFVDSEFIDVEGSKDGIRRLGEEQYKLIVSGDKEQKKTINLPAKKDELIFVQKPFAGWSDLHPTPFLVQRGLYKNMKILELLASKGENLIAKALEYLFMIKKGNERLALTENPDFIYSADDLEKVKTDLQTFLNEKKSTAGVPVYATNFDTDITHLIPDYSMILKGELSSPIVGRILAGLGLIEIIEGTASTRKESLLNPKPMMKEILTGIDDFRCLLEDLIETIIDKNKSSHKKIFTDKMTFQIHNSPVTIFFDDNLRQLLRSMYDRGVISKRTFTEVVGELDFDIESQRRTIELKDGYDELMYPPVVQNNEQFPNDPLGTLKPVVPNKDPNLEKKNKAGPEKKNFKSANEEEGELEYEEAPYKKNADLPPAVKKYPKHAQEIFRKTFNEVYQKSDEQTAFRIAWSALKNYIKSITKADIEEASEVEEMKEIETIKNLRNKNKLIKKLLKDEDES